MTRGWNAYVYRTDLEKEQFCGFFSSDAEAQTWVKKQRQGTYEVTDERPSKRISAEEADHADLDREPDDAAAEHDDLAAVVDD